MPLSVDPLWTHSPGAEMLVRIGPAETKVLRANTACCALLGMSEEALAELRSLAQFFSERTYPRFTAFSRGQSRRHMILGVETADGRRLDVRFLRAAQPDDDTLALVALQDLTEIQEEARALQAGYDEFIRITKELEDALGLIEKQNRLLEQQRNTMKQELVIAHRVQEHMFQLDFSQFKAVNVAGYYEAMDDLGGDMWEFFEGDGEFLGVLGDVMGHGVAASLISISIKTHFKKYFEEFRHSRRTLGELVSALNDEMLNVTDRRYFITAAMIRIGPDRVMEYLTAGHPPILIVPADREKAELLLFNEQPMLGIFDHIAYESGSVQLEPGDRVLLYTDCLTESANARGEVVDISRVGELIRGHGDNSPDEAVQEVLRYRTKFSGSTELPDDLTLICVEVPEHGRSATASAPAGERARLA